MRNENEVREEAGSIDPGQETTATERGSVISRRKMLATIGMAGAAVVAGGLLNGAIGIAHGEGSSAADNTNATGKKKPKPSDAPDNCCAVTIAELRATTALPAAGAVYYVKDHGQEGHFYYDAGDTTAADNTGTIVVSVAGARFKRSYEGPVNVKWFGAKGDAATNDTAAIQFCLDHFDNVYIPEGEFMVTGIVINREKVSLTGSGKMTTTLSAYAATDYVLRLYRGDLSLICAYVHIADLKIEGKNVAKTGISGGFFLCKVENISVRGTLEKAIYHVRGWSNVYSNVEITNNAGDGIVFNQECNNTVLENSEIHHNANGVILKSGGVFTIRSTGIENNTKNGLWITYQNDPVFNSPPYTKTGTGLVTIDTIYFENNGTANPGAYPQVLIDGDASEVSLRNCMFAIFESNAIDVAVNGADYTRNIQFDNCDFFGWDPTHVHLKLSSFYTDMEKRRYANIRALPAHTVYLNTDKVVIDGANAAQRDVWAKEIKGETASGTVTVNGVQFTVEKKGGVARLLLNGTATAAISQDIDFIPTGMDIRTSAVQELVAQRIYGYAIQTKNSGSALHATIPAGTAIDAESFIFHTER